MENVALRKKIDVGEKESVEDVCGKIEQEAFERIILRVASPSSLCANDFPAVARHADSIQKRIAVVSENNRVLLLAKKAGLEAIFESNDEKKRSFSDVAFRASARNAAQDLPEFLRKPKGGENSIEEKRSGGQREQPRKKRIITLVASGVACAAIFTFLYFELPRATIVVALEKTAVPFEETVLVGSKVLEPRIAAGKIEVPGELFTAVRNLELTFPVTGKEFVEAKARGKLVVYNAYSKESQTLVATTRFLSPDGKIYRLDKKVTVPGARVVAGKLEPSKIEVNVTADKAGGDYNTEPSSGWKIPGFLGTPRYEGFYAEAAEAIGGGLSGERPVPTDSDIAHAKQELESSLRSAVKGEIAVMLAPRFSVLPGTEKFTLLSSEIEPLEGDESRYSIFGEAELRQVVFEEATLGGLLVEKKRPAGSGFAALAFEIGYGTSTVNFENGSMSIPVKGKIVFEENVDKTAFQAAILGMAEDTARNYTFAVPGLEKATISLWPFWVRSVPDDANRVTVMFE